jgi:phasin family protein
MLRCSKWRKTHFIEGFAMLDSITKQFQDSFKPVSDIAAINAKALETLTQKQTALFSDMMSASVSYTEGFSSYKDLSDVAESQKAYVEEVQAKLTEAAKETYAVITETQEQAGEIMKGAFSQAQEAVKAAPKAAPAKK